MKTNFVSSWKARIRKTIIYSPLLAYKSYKSLKKYVTWRERAYYNAPEIFSNSGYLSRSSLLLAQRWSGQKINKKNSIKNVSLLVISEPNISAIWWEEELQRNFNAYFLSVTRHLKAFQAGRKDLLSFSIGVVSDDRFSTAGEEVKRPTEWKIRLQKDILEYARDIHSSNPIDLCLINGSRDSFSGETLKKLSELGIPVAFLWLDEKHAFLGDTEIANCCTLWLTNSLEAVRWYLARNIPVYYFPQAVDPEVYRPAGILKDIPVSFMGAAYGYRLDFIKKLKKANIPIQCFGRGWGNQIRDQIEIYNRTLINVGIGTTGLNSKITCIKGRDFEVPATEGLYLTTFDPELARLFDVGKEILCYRNELDCIEQIRYYLERPDEAKVIGVAGRKRVLREHTWTNRLKGLLQWMGILNANQYDTRET